MKIVFITTVASSIYGFRAPVIKKLIGKNHQVYAFVSEFSDNELDIIREMGVTPVTYRSNRSGLNPFSDIKSTFLIFKALKKNIAGFGCPLFRKTRDFRHFCRKIGRRAQNRRDAGRFGIRIYPAAGRHTVKNKNHKGDFNRLVPHYPADVGKPDCIKPRRQRRVAASIRHQNKKHPYFGRNRSGFAAISLFRGGYSR